MDEYKDRIIKALKDAGAPMGVNELSRCTDIKNNNTTKANCLELLIDKKIKALRTSTNNWLYYDKDLKIEG